MCPVPIDTIYAFTDSPWIEKLWDFFTPESGRRGYYCTDLSKIVPPISFLGDIGNFCPNSD